MNKIYPKEAFEQIAKNVHNDIENYRKEKKSSLVGIKMSDEGLSYTNISSNFDIYELLSNHLVVEKTKEDQYDLIALLTAGWAAPVKDDDENSNLPPSQHPERKRVKMTLVGNTHIQYGSVLSISGENEDMFDYMKASGALAESFVEFMKNLEPND
jgi:hypothetical protein